MRSSVPPARRRRGGTWLRWLAAVWLGGVVVGSASPALAEPVSMVTFHGGCGVLGLGGDSRPDVAEVTVAAGAEVTFYNEMTRSAVLRLDGEAVAEVASTAAATVRFGSGPVTVTMELQCLIGQPVGVMTVQVTPAAAPESSPAAPSPAAPPSAGPPVGEPSAPPAPAPGPATAPGDAAVTLDPSPGVEDHPTDPRPWSAPPPNVGGADEPSGAGPGPAESIPWIDTEPAQTADDGGAQEAGQVTVDESGSVVDPAVASRYLTDLTEPTSDDGLIGLLALLATVCVAGVSAGAVRAIIARRANRAQWA